MITDKLVAKIPSSYSGKITKLNYKNDEICQVGQPLLEMEVGDHITVKDEIKKEEHHEKAAAPAHPKEEPSKCLYLINAEAQEVHAKPTEGETKVLATPAVRALASEMKIDLHKVTATGKGGKITKEDVLKYAEQLKAPEVEGKVLATPAVRALANEMKVDIKKVKATGKGGKTTKEDVLKYAESLKVVEKPVSAPALAEKASKPAPVSKPEPIPVALEADRLVKLTGIRKAMAKSMTDALTIPHYNLQDEINIGELKKIRQKYAELNPGKKITYLPFFVKAFSLAMVEYPMFNAVTNPTTDKDGYIFEYIEKADHNISIAIDTPTGLLVPNIKAVQNKSILEINEAVKVIIDKSKAGALTQADLTDGTFTFSNIGNIGGLCGAPIIFRPQIALGATGYIRTLPEFVKQPNGEYIIKPKEVITVSLSCDHRIVDGATGARFVNRVKQLIENIESMLLSLK